MTLHVRNGQTIDLTTSLLTRKKPLIFHMSIKPKQSHLELGHPPDHNFMQTCVQREFSFYEQQHQADDLEAGLQLALPAIHTLHAPRYVYYLGIPCARGWSDGFIVTSIRRI